MHLRLAVPTKHRAVPLCALAALLAVSLPGIARSQDSANAVCVSAANREIGSVYNR